MSHQTFFKHEMRPKALAKADRVKRRRTTASIEDAKVKERSGGRCEVREIVDVQGGSMSRMLYRCFKNAIHVHHLLAGTGRRGVGESALAENKLHVCADDHRLIHAHILQGSWTDVNDRAGTITYTRLK